MSSATASSARAPEWQGYVCPVIGRLHENKYVNCHSIGELRSLTFVHFCPTYSPRIRFCYFAATLNNPAREHEFVSSSSQSDTLQRRGCKQIPPKRLYRCVGPPRDFVGVVEWLAVGTKRNTNTAVPVIVRHSFSQSPLLPGGNVPTWPLFNMSKDQGERGVY